MGEDEKAFTREITSDAEKRAQRTRQQAEREAARIVAEAGRAAEQERARMLEEARRQAERATQVNEARIRQDLTRCRLVARQQMVDRVRAEAAKALARLADGPQHEQALVALAASAVDAMAGDRFRLVLRPQDRARWGVELADLVRAEVKTRSGRDVAVEVADGVAGASGGLIVVGADGREVADQTFAARLERLWDGMRQEVAALLLPEPRRAP